MAILTTGPVATIVMKENNAGKCRAKTKNTNVWSGMSVQWFGWGTYACVMFDESDWPFTETYEPQISVPSGGYSSAYTVKTVAAQSDADYEYICQACENDFDEEGGVPGAKIIIDP